MLENINFQYRNLISVLFCKHERIKLKIKSSPENRYFFSVSNKALLGPNWGQLVDFRFSFGFLHDRDWDIVWEFGNKGCQS